LLAPVYSLNIVNQSFSGQSAVWFHHYRLSHQSLPQFYMHGLEFVTIELPNFNAAIDNDHAAATLWLRFLKEIKNRITMISQDLLEVPAIAEAIEALKSTSYSREELEQYDKYWDIVATQQTLLNDALRKGELKGKLEGEYEKATYAAEKLIIRGFSNEDIADVTGLNFDQIDVLRKAMN
jgi:predicted transposase/invertase (TIGR01784 family)